MIIYLDSETCGLHGMPVLFQYSIDDGEIILYDIWKSRIRDTLQLLEFFSTNTICGFNLVFDWFHICKLGNIFRHLNGDWVPEDHIEEIARLECMEHVREKALCYKPVAAMDLMLHARKGPYQSLMGRDDIKIKKVPTALAQLLAQELEDRVQIDDIYFARRKDKTKWNVYDREEPEFKDVVMKFGASGSLKSLAYYALGEKDIIQFADIEVPKSYWPEEKGYKPYGSNWPIFIKYHIEHWASREGARSYASNDIVYTRKLHHHFGDPSPGDDDSTLACAVAACRWRGYSINLSGLLNLRKSAINESEKAPKAPNAVRAYLTPVMSAIELAVLKKTDKVTLEAITEGTNKAAAERAQAVIDSRKATKEIELYDKLLDAGRFHASFKIIGTLSNRMSGADDLNPQAIKNTKEVRTQFPLYDEGYSLCGGDFDSFEVVLAEAVYKDPNLRRDLLAGKKIHALFGEELYDLDYDEIIKSQGSKEFDYYFQSKRGVFTMIYGGTAETMVNRLGVSLERAKTAEENFIEKYPGVGEARKGVFDQFCSMRQPGGIGSKVEWHEPSDFIETPLGFRRYFTLENRICKALFDLASDIPNAWKNIKVRVVRRERVQTASGAACSALYACAFAIQAANMRAAANHVIQAFGATITKKVQRSIWNVQPVGVQEFIVLPMNIHDEILCPTKIGYEQIVTSKVNEVVESFKDIVPLIKMKWNTHLSSWVDTH